MIITAAAGSVCRQCFADKIKRRGSCLHSEKPRQTLSNNKLLVTISKNRQSSTAIENDEKNVQRKVKKFLHMAQLDVGVVGVVHGAQNIL